MTAIPGRISDSFPLQNSAPDIVLQDDFPGTVGQPAWTTGAEVVSKNFSPPLSLSEIWNAYGWTINFNANFARTGNTNPYYATVLGELWAGLLIDTSLPGVSALGFAGSNASKAVFPNDLSTFSKIWDGQQDAPFPFTSSAFPLAAKPYTERPRGMTFLFPQPIPLRAGQDLRMGLILTPMLCDNLNLLIEFANFSVLYGDEFPERHSP